MGQGEIGCLTSVLKLRAVLSLKLANTAMKAVGWRHAESVMGPVD
jgi:hypothetical protein